MFSFACGEDGLLDGLGDRSRDVVVGQTTTEVPLDVSGPEPTSGLVRATSVAWYNDGVIDEAIGIPAYTISQVWERGHESGRFVQSSRAEIAVALPGIRFPAQIPGEVEWVTSQLVYLEDVATLDAGTSAAFGLWEVEPYSTDQGRVGVLRVGVDRADVPEDEVLVEVVADGLSLIWADGTYRYELFCRALLPETVCRRMADSAVPLRSLLATSS